MNCIKIMLRKHSSFSRHKSSVCIFDIFQNLLIFFSSLLCLKQQYHLRDTQIYKYSKLCVTMYQL